LSLSGDRVQAKQGGGKRLRAALVLLGCEAFGGRREHALHTAAAFEMFHSFALIHDDIEDGSTTRRGRPCLNHLHGTAIAINVGDAMYSKVFELLAANRKALGDAITLDLMTAVIRGAQLTFEGQAYDIGWTRESQVPTVDDFIGMLRRKTGWYSGRGPLEAGAIIAGATRQERQPLGEFGENMAVAFQIRDDLLNLLIDARDRAVAPGATSGGYGKERGGDIREGKRTLMVIHALE